MRIYLDNCCLQRPLDDKSQLRIRLESEAILAILDLCEKGTMGIISSEVLEIELDRTPHPQRKAYVGEILTRAESFIEVDEAIIQRAKILEIAGFKGMDALHLACAEAAHVDYFCSCDDRLVRQAKLLSTIKTQVVSPLELVEEIIR